MKLPSDPYILLSTLNMKLRDTYPDLDDLCRSLDVDRSLIESKLRDAGYSYDPITNQFKPI